MSHPNGCFLHIIIDFGVPTLSLPLSLWLNEGASVSLNTGECDYGHTTYRRG